MLPKVSGTWIVTSGACWTLVRAFIEHIAYKATESNATGRLRLIL